MKLRKALVLVIAFVMVFSTNVFSATIVTPEGKGNSYQPYELKGLGVGEYEFSVTSGNMIFLDVYTSSAAEVSIKEDSSIKPKITGPNNSYLAKFQFNATSSKCTVVVSAHKHSWNSSTGICTVCNAKCEHKSTELNGYEKDGATASTSHFINYKCKECGHIVQTKEKHSFKVESKGSNGSHYVKCTKCGESKAVNCKFSKIVKYNQLKAFDTKGYHHNTVYKCECGATKSVAQQHTFKNNKCTKCGFKRVIPGKVSSVKVTKKSSLKKKTVKWNGHWSGKEWIPAHTTTFYVADYTFKCNKPKNVSKYEIEYSPFVNSVVSGGKTVQLVSKNKFKFHFCLYKKSQTVTVKVTPISKTGTRGKTKKLKVKVR